MSIEAMAICLHHSEATESDKIVLLGIANHEGDGGSYPGVGTLAKYARFTGWDAEPVDDSKEARQEASKQRESAKRSARRACRRLEALGEIETITNGGINRPGGRSQHERTNLYRIKITCPPNCDRSSQHRHLSPEETEKRLRRELGLPEIAPVGPVDNSANDPRTLESPPDSGVRTPRTLESAEPSFNHNLGNSEPKSKNQSATEPEKDDEVRPVDDYSNWHPGEQVAKAAAVVNSGGNLIDDAAQKFTDAVNAKQRRHTPEPTPPPIVDEAQLALNEEAAQLPCAAGLGQLSRHWIPVTLTACVRCGREAEDILNEANQLEVSA